MVIKKTFWLAAAGVIFFSMVAPFSLAAAGPAAQGLNAVEGIVRGKVQKVGFRAFIFRQAIQYNLGGTIENLPDGSVHFALQGFPASLEKAVAVIRQGPAKADINEVEIKPAPVQNGISSVTVKGWTSTARNFQHPVDLVYPLRLKDQPITENEAHRIYKKIIRSAMASAGTRS